VQIAGTANPGDPLVVAGEGTWTVNPANGDITFTPDPGFTSDPTPIDYTVADNDGNVSNVSTVTVDYAIQPPTATNDSSTGNVTNTPVVLDVLGNDADPDGSLDPATVQIAGTANPGDPLVVPGEGTWSVNPANGEITFTPEPGFTANPAPINYTVADNDGNVSNPATVTVGYQTQSPVAANDSSTGNPTNTPVTINVTGNDADPDGTLDLTTLQIVGTANPGDSLVVPGEGTWSVNTTTGEFTFTPDPGFTADPTPIDYSIKDNDGNVSNVATVTIDYAAQPPTATNDSSTGNPTNTPVVIDVLGNDADPDGTLDPASVQIAGTTNPGDPLVVPGEGTWSVNPANGEITFTPEPGFTADPTPINYTVADNDGNVSNPATVTVEFDTQPPVATDDSTSGVTTGSPATIDVLNNDSDPDGSLDPATVQLGSTANPGDPLVVPGEGTWTVDPMTGAITFTPEPGFTADPTPITYTVSDNDGNPSNPATVTVDYDVQPPVATDDAVTGAPTNTPVVVPVLGNDNDPDGNLDPASVQIVGTANPGDPLVVPGEGTWSVDTSTGDITFTPEPGFTADPTPIDYTVADNDGNPSNPATVTIDFDAQPPVATGDSATGTPNSPVTIDVLANDGDPDGSLDPATVQLAGTGAPGAPLVVPGEGTWTVDPVTGAITFTPEPGFTSDPTPIDYTVSDNDGNPSNPAPVTIDYVALPPQANDDSAVAPPGDPVTVDPLANDADPDGVLDPASVQIGGTANPGDPLVVPGEGVWTVDPATGQITFTPEPGFDTDPTPITYSVADNDGNRSNPATITIQVANDQLPPTEIIPDPPPDGAVGNQSPGPVGGIPGETAVLQAVLGVREMRSGANGLGANGVVLSALEGAGSLNGFNNMGALGDRLDSIANTDSAVDGGYSEYLGHSLIVTPQEFGVVTGSHGVTNIYLETIVLNGIVHLSMQARPDGELDSPLREFTVRMADGRPLPTWAKLDERGHLVIEPGVHDETLELKIVAITQDVNWTIQLLEVDLNTGQLSTTDSLSHQHASGFSSQLASEAQLADLDRDQYLHALAAATNER